MATLPKSTDYGMHQTDSAEYPTTTYAVKDGRICGITDGTEAVRQAIDIILRTERYQYQIYTSNFGHELNKLIGKPPEYVASMIKRRIKEAFSVDKRILSVENFVFDESETGTIKCRVDVNTVFGLVQAEVTI